MKFRSLLFLIAAAALFLSLTTPKAASAQDIIVEPSPAEGSGHFGSIQLAIDEAHRLILSNPQLYNNLRIVVNAGTYAGTITLRDSNVPIVSNPSSGTAGTFISGPGTTVNINGLSQIQLRNFTFQNGATLSITNSTGIDVRNIVFALTGTGTAVKVSNSPTNVTIINNTFYNAAVGISTDSDIAIINNIFDHVTTAIATQRTLSQVTYNAFYNGSPGLTFDRNTTTNLPNNLRPELDPKFVNPPADFHLQSSSQCKGNGSPTYRNSFDNTSDIGAYGGPFSDPVVSRLPTVTGVRSELTLPATITVDWDASTDSSVSFYRVYYGTSPFSLNGTEATQGPSPVPILTGTTAVLSGFSDTAPDTPAVPRITSILPMNHALSVSWAPVPGATGYFLYVSTSSIPDSPLPAPILVGNNTSFKITGLTNGTNYFVRVAAIAQKTIYMAVTAVPGITAGDRGPQESLLSAETSQPIGELKVSLPSEEVHDFPEATAPYPNLKSGGCFIATAAYGFYSAPQVQALRIFRDRYLMTNAPGRAFVAWYYHYGPRGAAYLNAHPGLKPPVRLALLPLVALSFFLIYTPPLLKLAMLLVALGIWSLYRRKLGERSLLAGRVR